MIYFDGRKDEKDTEKWMGGIVPALEKGHKVAEGSEGYIMDSEEGTSIIKTTTVAPTTPPNAESPACFPGHAAWAKSEEGQCPAAGRFVSSVCRSFQDCMNDKRTSYWICKPKICSEYRKRNEKKPCAVHLFNCSEK
ncbi:hypothetical protein OSTOST_08499 [Ostertagia ostertagi]